MTLEIVRTAAELAGRTQRLRGDGRLALVPTMGAIHDGHVALVKAARAKSQRIVASIFVNPTQFGPNEDFAAYPRDEGGDAAKLEAAGCDLLYVPDVAEIYPQGPVATVSAGPLGEVLEGKFRPGHFDGVATVVATLFEQVRPDLAAFGEKDYQQLLVIDEMVRTRGFRIEILPVPVERAPSGLALSSRNAYLTAEERRIAPELYRTLFSVAERVLDKRTTVPRETSHAVALLAQAGFDSVDYVAVCDAETLAPLEEVTRPARVLGAARLGRTRLIDNVPVLIPGR